MSIPPPPDSSSALSDFPSQIWKAHQPLARVHLQEFGTLYFGADPEGRWNPPEAGADWGTCYLSTHPVGAAPEVFGRFRLLPQREIDRRVLATVYLASDLRLADMTHPSIVGRFGLTAEASTGEEEATYRTTQRWALRLREAGFAGIHYAARHDPSLGSRSVAIFGKATSGDGPTEPWAEWAEESTATTSPVPPGLIEELRETYGFKILGGGRSL